MKNEHNIYRVSSVASIYYSSITLPFAQRAQAQTTTENSIYILRSFNRLGIVMYRRKYAVFRPAAQGLH